jgi:hypothetical protein
MLLRLSLLAAALHNWQAFYQLTGEVAGTLVGLMFIAISLTRNSLVFEQLDSDAAAAAGIRTFATPTILHFCAVVAVAAICCIPTHTTLSLSICLDAIGLGGMIFTYTTYTGLRERARRVAVKQIMWIWHLRFPSFCYALVLASGLLLRISDGFLTLLSVAIIGLVAIGVKNSWEAVLEITGVRSHH